MFVALWGTCCVWSMETVGAQASVDILGSIAAGVCAGNRAAEEEEAAVAALVEGAGIPPHKFLWFTRCRSCSTLNNRLGCGL